MRRALWSLYVDGEFNVSCARLSGLKHYLRDVRKRLRSLGCRDFRIVKESL